MGERQFGRHLRDNLGERNCESKIAARQWGVNEGPARHQDASQGLLGNRAIQIIRFQGRLKQ